jgi:hypothetical protein
MKFFILSAVLAACVVSSLVRFKIALRLSLQCYHLMAKCLRRVALSIPWAHRKPTFVAPAPRTLTTVVSIKQLVHLIAVMASGMYSIGNRFQTTYIVNPLHNDSNIFGCNCDNGCRLLPDIKPKQQSLESSIPYLCVELSFVIRRCSLLFQRGR